MYYSSNHDMSQMKKPTFIQVPQVQCNFQINDADINEFTEYQRFNYDQLNFEIPMVYRTTYGLVEGVFKLQSDKIVFQPNESSVIDTLTETTTKSEKDITQEVIDKFAFILYLDDIYSTNICRIDNQNFLQFYLYGVLAVDPPLKNSQDQISLVRVQVNVIKENQKIKQQIQSILGQDDGSSTIFALNQLFTMLFKKQRFHNNAIIYENSIKKQTNYEMKCLSEISYYDLIPFKQMQQQSVAQAKYSLYKMNIPELTKPTFILTHNQFEKLCHHFSINNPWHLAYTPRNHGTSQDQFLRRVTDIGPIFILIKDQREIVFGLFMQGGWVSSGQPQSTKQIILFSFQNQFKAYESAPTKQDLYRTSDDGLQFGEQLLIINSNAITINKNFEQGENHVSELFNNNLLTSAIDFKIVQLEVWGVDARCELYLRKQKQESILSLQ